MKDKIFAKKFFIGLSIVFGTVVFFLLLITVPSDANYVADDFSYIMIDGEKYYGMRAHILDDKDISASCHKYTNGNRLYLESEVGKPIMFPYRYSYRQTTVANDVSAIQVSSDTDEVYLYCAEKDMAALRDLLENEPTFSHYAALNLPNHRIVTLDDYIDLSDELTKYVSSIEPLAKTLHVDCRGKTSFSHEPIDIYILDETHTIAKHVASVLTVDGVIYLLPEYGEYMVFMHLDGKKLNDDPCNATLDDIEKYRLPDELTNEITKMMAK